MLDQLASPPPLAVSFPDGIINGRHHYSVIGDEEGAATPKSSGGGSLSSWTLAIGLWIDINLPAIRAVASGATVAGWIGIVAWLALNLVGGW